MATPFSPDKSPDRITPDKSVEPTGTTPSKAPGDFESHMRGTAPPTPSGTAPAGPTPMEAARPPGVQPGAPSMETILTQAKTAHDSLGTVGQQLNTPNLKFKRSQSRLLRNKLHDANDHLRSAGEKLGIQTPPMKTPAHASPLDRFLAYVNDGQEQMLAVQQKLKDISAQGQQINPADMLFAQVKLNRAQQEIEYSSVLLSKVIDSLKTIMNIQL